MNEFSIQISQRYLNNWMKQITLVTLLLISLVKCNNEESSDYNSLRLVKISL